MTRDSFVFYRSYKKALQALPIEQQLRLLNAIIDYALDGIEPNLDGIEMAFFELVRPQINANNVKYENGCKGGQYGKLGGAPKVNKNAAKKAVNSNKTTPKQPQNNPKTTRNDNVNENENENVCNNAHTRAREEFCKRYQITDDLKDDTHTEELDFGALDWAYSKSVKWLQKSPASKCLSFVVKNYASIIAGKYEDMGGGNSPRVTSDYLADELNAVFERLNEEL